MAQKRLAVDSHWLSWPNSQRIKPECNQILDKNVTIYIYICISKFEQPRWGHELGTIHSLCNEQVQIHWFFALLSNYLRWSTLYVALETCNWLFGWLTPFLIRPNIIFYKYVPTLSTCLIYVLSFTWCVYLRIGLIFSVAAKGCVIVSCTLAFIFFSFLLS